MQSRGAMVDMSDVRMGSIVICGSVNDLRAFRRWHQRIIRRLRGRNEGNRLVTSVRSVAKCATEQDKLLWGLR